MTQSDGEENLKADESNHQSNKQYHINLALHIGKTSIF